MMKDRIKKLLEITLAGGMYNPPVKTEFDREDLFLSENERDVKRLCEYIRNQEPLLTEASAMTGIFNFDGSVVGDAFQRGGHRGFETMYQYFYCIPIENVSTFEWQHATADYAKLLKKGISGIVAEIEESLAVHDKPEEKEFLLGLKAVAGAMVDWAHKCSRKALDFSQKVDDPEYKANLERLSETLQRVPEQAPESFYEAVLSIYLCFSADPDSLGTLDRYLAPFYEKDLAEGKITEDEAKEYLQELFLMVQGRIRRESDRFFRGGESHFCIGGYLPNGEDGFCATSRLIVESLMELPIYIPQMTLRWTKKTPREVLRYMMDKERKDNSKRIAFTNDEKRLKAYTEICGIPYERAVSYTTVGCNEPVFLGAIVGGTSNANILRCVERLFHEKGDEIRKTVDFEDFYGLFERELQADLDVISDYDDKYNLERA